MSRFVISADARADLLAIGQYSQNRWGIAARRRYLFRFETAFEMLVVQPGLGGNRDDIRMGLRSLVVARHVIYFDLIAADQIRIIRVLHQAMDVSSRASFLAGHLTAQ